MQRIEINYDGSTYHITNRPLEEVQREIAGASDTNTQWLTVRDGTGADVYLKLSAHIPIALLPIPDPHKSVDPTL